ncbi:h-sco1, partial [Sistotremastrum suecicum HHB10207 ss-3]
RDRAAVGVFTPQAAAIFVLTGIGLFYYFKSEKERIQEAKRQALASKKIGRAAVGGPFSLVTHDGKPFTEKDMLGKWSVMYFGFTNCPDICPAELDKMGAVVDEVAKRHGKDVELLPIFVSVDPARDDVQAMKKYVADFHPSVIGLTGSYPEVKATCKAYRVYFSSPPPPEGKPSLEQMDYLVDHSIYFYLMDPRGEFVEAFGKDSSVEKVADRLDEELARWKGYDVDKGEGPERLVVREYQKAS